MLDGDFIGKEDVEAMASKLFKEPMILDMLKGKGAYVTLIILINEACNHVRPLYVTTKFDGQLGSRILINNRVTLNDLPTFMLRKLGKIKFDMLPTNLIMTNFCGTIV